MFMYFSSTLATYLWRVEDHGQTPPSPRGRPENNKLGRQLWVRQGAWWIGVVKEVGRAANDVPRAPVATQSVLAVRGLHIVAKMPRRMVIVTKVLNLEYNMILPNFLCWTQFSIYIYDMIWNTCFKNISINVITYLNF